MEGSIPSEHDCENRPGTVEFATDKGVSTADVVAYFEDASDGKVELIRIIRHGKATELRRPFAGA